MDPKSNEDVAEKHLIENIDLSDQEGYQWMSYLRFVRYARPLAYSNELGEAFRHNYPKIIKPLYGLSFGYIGLDIAHKVHEELPEKRAIKTFDMIVWHSIASLVLPGFAVNRTVHFSKKYFESPRLRLSARTRHIAPVALGLGIIPLIIKPIDHFTDGLLDKTIRKFY